MLQSARAWSSPEAPLDMVWDAPPGCPAYSDVESWLHAVIPPDARARLGELHVKVLITGNPGSGFRASVRVVRDGASEPPPGDARVVEGPACGEVARSAMVVVSVEMSDAIKAEAAEAIETRPPAPSAPAAPPSAPPPLAAPPRPPADRSEAASRRDRDGAVLVAVLAGAESGFMGQPGVRLDLSASLALRRATFLGLRVHALPAVTLEQGAELGRLHFVAPGAELCQLQDLSRAVRVGACARAEFGFAWAEGAEEDDPTDSGPIGAVALTPTLAVGGSLRFLLQGDLELRVIRPRFENTAGKVLAVLPPLAVGGLAGLSLALP